MGTAVASMQPVGRLRPATVGWVLAAWSAASAVTAVALDLAWSSEPTRAYSVVLAVVYPVVGALVATRQPRNAVGWLLIAIGLTEGWAILATSWAWVALDVPGVALPGGRVAAWFADWMWIPGHDLLLTFLPLLFPSGRLPSRRWWPVAAFAGVAMVIRLSAPMTVISQIPLRDSLEEFYPDERLATWLGTMGHNLIRIAAVASLVALLWRLARMPRDERGPLVWFALGAAGTVLLVVPLSFVTEPVAHQIVQFSSVLVLPVGASVAILRHRAYGIDVVVNRTLVYVALSAVLVGVYLGSAALVEVLVGGAGVAATIAAAASSAVVLNPVRERLQRVVDHMMYGERDEAHRVVAAIASRLEVIVHGSDVLTDAAEEVARALRLPYVGVEVQTRDGARELGAYGEAESVVERVPLLANGEVVGQLAASPRRGQEHLAERDLAALRAVATIAATAVRQLQLTDELRRARGRLANVLAEERRRIRRDLHDGLGPTLATVVMGLEEARAVHRRDPDRADELLLDLKAQTRAAVDDVRALVYGLRPPALDDLGLVGALEQLTSATMSRTGLAVHLDADDRLAELPAAVEVAAYRIVQEALTNIVRHAVAKTAAVTLTRGDDHLAVRIRDDGRGLPDALVPGVGLASMRERAEDLAGTVRFTSDRGTLVEATLPLMATT